MAHFEWENGAHATDRIGQTILLGRAEYADVRFQDDMGCSREQARLEPTTQGWILQPVSQNTMTFVNGTVLGDATLLADGDIVSFSAQRLIFRDDMPQEQLSVSQSDAPRHSTPASRQGISGSSGDVIIGRSTDHATFILEHPAVSRRHALFRGGSGASIRDLGSTNGTYVNGHPVQGDHRLSIGDRIEIGPFSLVFDGASLGLQSRPGEVALSGIGLCVDVPKPGGGVQTILNQATVSIEPREFVCIVGPSGSGKSTLIRVLSGRNVPTRGTVQVGELDLFENFDSLKQEISFVPQHDVLHETLTLESALTYTAKLRLPVDTSATDRRLLVRAAARDVDLEDRLGNRIATLSGGQKKRASLASETLSQPGLVFLDEVTSGLDEATDREIMRMLRQKAAAGMTVVCITHTMVNVEEFCDRLIVMAEGGVVAFSGAPRDALSFFEVERLGQIFDCLKTQPKEHWLKRGESGAYPPSAHSISSDRKTQAFSFKPVTRFLRQFGIVTCRNLELITADRRGFAMAASQSILIGFFVGFAFNDFGAGYEVVNSQNALLLLLGLCSIWLGCNSASQEIVGELEIFKREHDVNLSAAAFVLSKFSVGALYTGLQFCVAFGLVSILAQELPGPPTQQLLFLLVGCLAGTAMGLLLSSLANTNEQATMIVPLILVPQLIFAGVLVPKLPEVATYFAEVAVSGYWLTEGLKSNLIEYEGPINTIDVTTGVPKIMTAASAGDGTVVIIAHCLVFLMLTVFFTKRRASR